MNKYVGSRGCTMLQRRGGREWHMPLLECCYNNIGVASSNMDRGGDGDGVVGAVVMGWVG